MSSKKSKGYWQEKNEVMIYYNTIEPSYELQYSEEQDKKYDVVLPTLDFIDHEKIIDVGCGTGLLFSKIRKRYITIVGVDVSMNLLNRAIKRFKHRSNVHFICGDADFLPLRENVFDKVFSITLLQNMPEPSITLKEIAKVAKQNSTLIISVQKKKLTKDELLIMLQRSKLHVIKFLEKGIKDYLAICKKH
jgi:malonyl-CoA O-methyltransferase